jgi:hypothetical protein
VLAAILALLLAGGATAGVVAKRDHDDMIAKRQQAKRDAAKARRDKAELDRQVADAEAESKRMRDEIERDLRSDVIRSLERSVAKDAKKDVSLGVIDGPIVKTQCDPTGSVDVEDLAVDTADYECIAANKTNADGTLSGYRFSASVNFADSSYTWHLGG